MVVPGQDRQNPMISRQGAAERVPTLQGSRNFRDLGGYATGDGRSVRWGMLYRSGSLARFTPADLDQLKAFGITGLCDLRTKAERTAEPYPWHADMGLSYWSRDYDIGFGELRSILASGLSTGQAAKDGMIAGYRRLPFEQAPAYRELFRRLAAGELPLIFNCSAGKDRTGAAAALILSALGVPRATIVEDYALTDQLLDLGTVFRSRASSASLVAAHPPEVIDAIVGCDPAYIQAALHAVGAGDGPPETYLREVLGVSAQKLEQIRANLLN